jgi:Flp pilus assembly protein TadG
VPLAPDGLGSDQSPSIFVRFAEDRRGGVAITFGLTIVMMLTLVGAAVDISVWMQARKQTQEAIDSAALAGLRKYQDGNDVTAAVTTAQVNYTYNVTKRGGRVLSDNIAFVLKDNNTSMTATGNVVVAMPFLKLAGVASMPVLKMDMSEHAITKLAQGKNTGQSLEVSMMIDITGSMGESDNSGSTKIETVKKAAADAVDILVWDDQSTFTSKVAVVPFSEAVKFSSSSLVQDLRGPILSGNPTTTPGYTTLNYTGYDRWGNPTPASANISNWCVTERTGFDKYTDVSPTVSPLGRFYGNCSTGSAVLPLTSNKTTAKNLINSLQANGTTAGHMGTAWAWYMLSPNFNSVLGSTARPYTDLTTLNAQGKPVLRKIAILMTDGDYNTEFCNGLNSDLPYGGCTPNNGTSGTQAGALCTAMKAKGIEVYTIGAQVSTAAKNFLKTCATDTAHYYDATDGNKLKQAFIDIAYKLVPPYISH